MKPICTVTVKLENEICLFVSVIIEEIIIVVLLWFVTTSSDFVLYCSELLTNSCLGMFRCTEYKRSKVDGSSIKNDRQPIKSKPPFNSINKSYQSNQAG